MGVRNVREVFAWNSILRKRHQSIWARILEIGMAEIEDTFETLSWEGHILTLFLMSSEFPFNRAVSPAPEEKNKTQWIP